MEETLRDRRVVISGGTTGIGLATARMLAAEGARLLVFGRHRPELERALEAIRAAGGEAHGLTADQAEPAEVERVFTEVDTRLGGVDVLVNNAATSLGSLEELSAEEIRYEVSANLGGYLACAHEALRRMGKGAHVVNVGSMSADLREEGNAVYVATKAAIQGFSESLRKTVNPRGIRVTLIEPGKVDTELVDLPREEKERLKEAGEMLEPEDVAAAIRYALLQPPRCDVVEIRLRPIGQNI